MNVKFLKREDFISKYISLLFCCFAIRTPAFHDALHRVGTENLVVSQ